MYSEGISLVNKCGRLNIEEMGCSGISSYWKTIEKSNFVFSDGVLQSNFSHPYLQNRLLLLPNRRHVLQDQAPGYMVNYFIEITHTYCLTRDVLQYQYMIWYGFNKSDNIWLRFQHKNAWDSRGFFQPPGFQQMSHLNGSDANGIFL